MGDRNVDAAYTELTPDSWHQDEAGNYYIDCPECGSAASLLNVAKHGRCNGYLDQQESGTDLDGTAMDCTAKLWFELGYTADADAKMTDDAVAESTSDVETEDGVPAEGSPPGTNGTVDDG
ncbi:hypothetical protein [Natronobacterium gregoryi]|uniref:Uncharacterized protein n=2 Tax=Natronobacterium gregoryi TaxID=44930 RepID=L0AGA6_NATGS|nr:hypothetical protein [Natronobacterium gregoryi]AFZ72958.1 hypothetical protein Natgr_1763 [Natronobacterium gregoryi SP2]ELY69894.1 hypothetical protein C490_07084 [Natronobacterium gregoryi SP2]PLK21818.1 hypothetical protein CYV19_01585 [Natronobacterium gregoryi SP2]SFI68491.1 hypothetical protein SAMN05443661_103129 [Natronobacterium gregoryi]